MATSSSPVQADVLRAQLLESLRGGSAHADPKTALGGISAEDRGKRAEGLPHTPWQIVEHIRITLADLYEFSTNPEYVEMDWPGDYWPKGEAPADETAWDEACEGLLGELKRFEELVEDAGVDLLAPIAWGQGQNVLREVLLAVSHTSYHLGQLVTVRQSLGDWKH